MTTRRPSGTRGWRRWRKSTPLSTNESIDCHWAWVPGYKFAALTGDVEKERARLQAEAATAAELGFEARFLDAVPFFNRPGVELAGQARFHPRLYLAALATRVDGNGSHVFEHTESEEVVDDPLSIKAGGRTIACDHIVIATHTPLMGKTNIVRRHAVPVEAVPVFQLRHCAAACHPARFPTRFSGTRRIRITTCRLDRRRDYDIAIFGGQDHKTGQAADTEACYAHARANGPRN